MIINLLPPEQKKELQGEKKFKTFVILGLTLIFLLISLNLLLLFVKFSISQNIEVEKILLEAKRNETLSLKSETDNLKKINSEILKFEKFYQENPKIMFFLEKIPEFFPSEIYFDSLTLALPSKIDQPFLVSLHGLAPTRQDLVSFKEKLGKNFEEVIFPPTVWLGSAEINFSVNFKWFPK